MLKRITKYQSKETIFVTGQCFEMSKAVIEVIEREIVKQRLTELCSNQDVSDTKMFLAAKFVSSGGCNSVPVRKGSFLPRELPRKFF